MNLLIQPVIDAVLNWLKTLITGLYQLDQRQKKDHKTRENEAAQAMKKAKELKRDSTAKETDDAIDDSLSRF